MIKSIQTKTNTVPKVKKITPVASNERAELRIGMNEIIIQIKASVLVQLQDLNKRFSTK